MTPNKEITMTTDKNKIVTGYAQMWPREVFNVKKGKQLALIDELNILLKDPGVYVLYRDDRPYYIGKATATLANRIWSHANQLRDKYYNFWNFFSAWTVPEKRYISQVEGILIAAMPTANSANPHIHRIRLSRRALAMVHNQRTIKV
jgi:hypothetical protein